MVIEGEVLLLHLRHDRSWLLLLLWARPAVPPREGGAQGDTGNGARKVRLHAQHKVWRKRIFKKRRKRRKKFRFLRLRGNNCEYCLDDHNDVPWRPGTGKKKNECKSEAHIQSRDKHILKDFKCSQNCKTVKGGKIKLIRICFYSYVTFCFVYAVSRGDLIALSKKKLFLGTEYVYIGLIHFRVQLPRPRRILLLQPLRV